jgi:hypothetical protein
VLIFPPSDPGNNKTDDLGKRKQRQELVKMELKQRKALK